VSPTKSLAIDGLTPRTMKGGLLPKEATSSTAAQPTESTVADPEETEAASDTSPLKTINPKLLDKGALDGLRPATGADVLAAMATPEPELAFAKPQPVEPSVELRVDQDAGTTQDRNVILNHEVTYHPGQSGTPLRYRASETSFSEQSTSPQWQMYDTTPDFDLTPGAGPKTVYFQVEARIEADETDVLASQVVSDQIELAGPPAPGLTLILPDQVYSPQVSLDYSIDPAGASVQQWRSADTATELQTRAWRSIGTPLVHSVSPTAGPKTIHFQLRINVSGGLIYSEPASASTQLVIPTLGAKFEINNDDPATTNRVLTLNNAGHFFPQGTPPHLAAVRPRAELRFRGGIRDAHRLLPAAWDRRWPDDREPGRERQHPAQSQCGGSPGRARVSGARDAHDRDTPVHDAERGCLGPVESRRGERIRLQSATHGGGAVWSHDEHRWKLRRV
jgi:hypothetical protein